MKRNLFYRPKSFNTLPPSTKEEGNDEGGEY